MKFIAVLALTLSMVLIFASCKPQPPAVISSGKTFELATDKDGNALYDRQRQTDRRHQGRGTRNAPSRSAKNT